MNTHATFLRAILHGQFESALAYSDWLQERGDIQRAILLKRRYKTMATQIANAQELANAKADRAFGSYLDKVRRVEECRIHQLRHGFFLYVRERFASEIIHAKHSEGMVVPNRYSQIPSQPVEVSQ